MVKRRCVYALPTPLGDPVNDESFEYLVRQAFSQRRKTLRNTLKGLRSEELIVEAGIDPGVRPERVTVEEYTRLVSGWIEHRLGNNAAFIFQSLFLFQARRVAGSWCPESRALLHH